MQDEIERLRHLSKVLEKYPAFSRQESEVKDLTEKFIEKKTRIIAHYAVRKELPFKHWKRLLPVARELSSGRYNLFSKGILSAAKDLFEK